MMNIMHDSDDTNWRQVFGSAIDHIFQYQNLVTICWHGIARNSSKFNLRDTYALLRK